MGALILLVLNQNKVSWLQSCIAFGGLSLCMACASSSKSDSALGTSKSDVRRPTLSEVAATTDSDPVKDAEPPPPALVDTPEYKALVSRNFKNREATNVVVVNVGVSSDSGPEDSRLITETIIKGFIERLSHPISYGSQTVQIEHGDLELVRIQDRTLSSFKQARLVGQKLDADIVLFGNRECEVIDDSRIPLKKNGASSKPVSESTLIEVSATTLAPGAVAEVPEYPFCLYAALVDWQVRDPKAVRTQLDTLSEVSEVFLGKITADQTSRAVDTTVALHFAKRYQTEVSSHLIQSIYQEAGSSKDSVRLALWLARIQRSLGFHDVALRSLELMEQSEIQSARHPFRGEMFNDKGAVYFSKRNYKKALRYYQQALPIHRAMGNLGGQAISLSGIARVAHAEKRLKNALANYKEALSVFRAVEDKHGEAWTINNIGEVYSRLGERKQALVQYNEALKITKMMGSRSGEATILDNIAGIYSRQQKKDLALNTYSKALALHKVVHNLRGQAATLFNMGMVYVDLKSHKKSLGYFLAALPILSELGDLQGQVWTLQEVAKAYAAVGDKPKARAHKIQYFRKTREHLVEQYPKLLEVKKSLGTSEDEHEFVFVSKVLPGAQGDQLGLKVGDVLYKFAGAVIRSPSDIPRLMKRLRKKKQTLIVLRGADKLAVEVKPGALGLGVEQYPKLP